MFRRTILAAALALAAAGGAARADNGPYLDPANLAALRGSATPLPTMSGFGARAEIIAGMGNLVIVYGPGSRGLQTGGAPVITTDGDGTYHTVYGR